MHEFFDQYTLQEAVSIDSIKKLLETHHLKFITGKELRSLLKSEPSITDDIASICNNISVNYKVNNLIDAIVGFEGKECIFLVSDDFDVNGGKKRKRNNDVFHSILVCQRGKCRSKPDSMVITLLCSRRSKGIPLGSLTLCTFLIIAKVYDEKDILLQVANGYENIHAISFYEKFSFVEDISLFDPKKSFWDSACIPMRLDLSKLDLKEIIGMMNKKCKEIDCFEIRDRRLEFEKKVREKTNEIPEPKRTKILRNRVVTYPEL